MRIRRAVPLSVALAADPVATVAPVKESPDADALTPEPAATDAPPATEPPVTEPVATDAPHDTAPPTTAESAAGSGWMCRRCPRPGLESSLRQPQSSN